MLTPVAKYPHMPSGATHDRITLWISPLVAGLTWVLTQSDRLTLITVGTFLAGGLLLSPDLDIRSRPYKRWGWLRWLWLPYQKSIRHRSWLSHGWIIGTLLRIGLELGAMSHGVSDGIYSGYERCVRGWQKSSKGRSGK